MNRIGTESAGVTVDYNLDNNEVLVEAHGFLPREVGMAFGETVMAECKRHPEAKVMRLDMTQLKPMADEGKKSFGTLIASLGSLGIKNAFVKTGSALTKLQLLTIVCEKDAADRVHFK